MLGETQITVAILSGNPLVGRVLELLLGSAGYEVRLLEEPEAFEVADLLAGVDVLLLDRGVSDERRVDFLGAMASKLETASIPVLALSPGPEGALAAEDRLVPWPTRVEDLAREIDAVLQAAGGRQPATGSRAPTEEASA